MAKQEKEQRHFKKVLVSRFLPAALVVLGTIYGASNLIGTSQGKDKQSGPATATATAEPTQRVYTEAMDRLATVTGDGSSTIYNAERLKAENIDRHDPNTFARFSVAACRPPTASSAEQFLNWFAPKAEAAPLKDSAAVQEFLKCIKGISAQSPIPFLVENGLDPADWTEQNVIGMEPESIEFNRANLVQKARDKEITMTQAQVNRLLGVGNGAEISSVFRKSDGTLAKLVLKILDDKKAVDAVPRPNNLVWKGEKGWTVIAKNRTGQFLVVFIFDECRNVVSPVSLETAPAPIATATEIATEIKTGTETPTATAVSTSTAINTETAAPTATSIPSFPIETGTPIPTPSVTPTGSETPTPLSISSATPTETGTTVPSATEIPTSTTQSTIVPQTRIATATIGVPQFTETPRPVSTTRPTSTPVTPGPTPEATPTSTTQSTIVPQTRIATATIGVPQFTETPRPVSTTRPTSTPVTLRATNTVRAATSTPRPTMAP